MSHVVASTTEAPAPARRRQASSLPQLDPMYNVVLLDDDEHTYQYVIEMLCAIFGHAFETAYMMACEVDRSGRVVVYTAARDEASTKRDQIQAFGADPLLAGSGGSMDAVVEPAQVG